MRKKLSNPQCLVAYEFHGDPIFDDTEIFALKSKVAEWDIPDGKFEGMDSDGDCENANLGMTPVK